MKQISIFVCLLTAVFCAEDELQPLYNYRYQTEDLMKTAASTIPLHGYHVVEGGYYPGLIGGAGFGGAGLGGAGIGGAGLVGGGAGLVGGGLGYGAGIGAGGLGVGGGLGYGGGGAGLIGPIGYGGIGLKTAGLVGAGLGGAGIGGAGIGLGGGAGLVGGGIGPIGYGGLIGGYGGEVVDKNVYGGGKKIFNDEGFEKAQGNKGEQINHGQEGFTQGKAAIKEAKGDSGYYNDVEGGKKLYEDGKAYHGLQKFNTEGKNAGEKKIEQGHKKGHVIKGFKSSHHKDESGKTEEFYDEENDEGKNFNYAHQGGAFAENAGSAFKGGHEDGKFNSGEAKKEGHYDNEHFVDNTNGGQGAYGSKKYAGNGAVYGLNNGIDQSSLLGHQEANKIYKYHPHVPFY